MVVMEGIATHIISKVVYVGYKSVIITTHKNGQISIGPRARCDDACCGSVLGQFIFVQTLT